MEEKKSMVKTVVLIAIGAVLFGIGGLPAFSIPIFAETSLKPAEAILAFFAVVYGPFVGAMVGLLGNLVTDLFAGWGVWIFWILSSALEGAMIGMFRKVTHNRLSRGEFWKRDAFILTGISVIAIFISKSIAGILDYFFYAEPINKLITQVLIIVFNNGAFIAILGTLLVSIYARRIRAKMNLVES